jgi:ribosomal protein S18 acetylase RimI-like enzyme
MNLLPSNKTHIPELMNWFPDQRACAQWGGPDLRFPFTEKSFLQDIHWEKMPSYSALTEEGHLLGFGQFYEKLGRCHLARLTIAPQFRGLGLGRKFISSLMAISKEALGKTECSLFVLEQNLPAVACYKSLGFSPVEAPEAATKLKDCIFMITAFD